MQRLVAAPTLSNSDDTSFIVIKTASFEPTLVLPANNSATDLAEDAASSADKQVRAKPQPSSVSQPW
jgi:hypothetical protein